MSKVMKKLAFTMAALALLEDLPNGPIASKQVFQEHNDFFINDDD